jgi:hypothetical protein
MKAQSTRFGPIARRCAVWLLLASLSARGQQFVEITAAIDLLCYRADDPNGLAKATPRTISVVCITSTSEWRIEDDWVRESVARWHFDGTNVYNSLQATKPMPEEMRELIARTSHFAEVPFEVARSNLTINVWPSRDGHPLGDMGVNISWLAFCSGPYLRREGRLVPLPVETLRHTRDRFAYTDKTEVFRDSLGLPRTLDLYLSRSLFLTSENDFDKEYSFGDRYTEWTKKTAQTLDEGAHMFHYEVLETTHFLGWSFPSRFAFFQNGRKFEQNGNWAWRGTGKVTSIRAVSRPAGLFDPSYQQTVVDWRFQDAVTYVCTNRSLSPTNDPLLQKKFAERAAQLEGMRKLSKEAPPDAR